MSCRVLIAEPDQEVRDTLCDAVEDAGGVVFPAGTLREGLEIVVHEVVQASVIDECLPDGSGFDLLDAIRRHFSQPIPCILTSARPTKEVRLRALSAGVVTIWPLPFPRERIVISFQRIVIRYSLSVVVLTTGFQGLI